MMKVVMIAAGGSIGALLRYVLGMWIQSHATLGFPYGTFVVNALGSLVIGFLAAYFSSPQMTSEAVRLGIMVGLLGSFTTFSTFSLDNFNLLIDGRMTAAVVNAAGSVLVGLTAVWFGYSVGVRIYGA